MVTRASVSASFSFIFTIAAKEGRKGVAGHHPHILELSSMYETESSGNDGSVSLTMTTETSPGKFNTNNNN